jgi:hypothetical protein
MSLASSQPGRKTSGIVIHAIWLLAIAVLYAILFLLPLPLQIRKQGIFLTDEFLLFLLLALVFFSYRQQGWGAKYLRLGLVLIAFTLPLLRLWETAESTWNIVLGLLPWADATEYYFDANRLLNGGLFSAFSGRRPLYASLLTTFLSLSHQNLQIVLVIFTIINALAVFLFVEEIYNEFGSISAIVALFLCQLFYRPFVGTLLTEQLGYSIGLLAVILLVQAVKITKPHLFALGLALVTFALLIRAGTFFVLPILIAFGVVKFAENRREYLKVSLIMIAAVAIPMLTNAGLKNEVASPNAVAFANFADTLYGQARGGVRWTQAAIDHPELVGMPEPDRSRLLYSLTFEEIKNHPLGLVKGSGKALLDFILPGFFSAFGFLTFGNKTVDFLFQASAALLFLIGLWMMWKSRRNPISTLLLLFWIGTLLSIPFLPPVDAGIRPYAATIASVFLPVCFVFSQGFFRSAENSQEEYQKIPSGVSYTLACALIAFSLLGTPLLKTTIRPTEVPSLVCEAGLTPIHFRLINGSYISLVSATGVKKTRVPVVLLSDIQKSFDHFQYPDFAQVVRKIKQPVMIAATTDLATRNGIWVVAHAEEDADQGQIVSACAEMVGATYPVMFVRTVESP